MTDEYAPDYAPWGRFGIGVPQANPTVEPEMAILMPPGASLHPTRLTSPAADAEERLVAYLERLPELVRSYDTLRLQAFGFACTGSTYLLGRERARRCLDATSEALGCPVESAAEAILSALEALGLRRIALVAPYPGRLGEASLTFWQDAGLTVTSRVTLDIGGTDTRGIYALTSEAALAALDRLDLEGAEALLLAGTGLPSLRAIAEGRSRLGLPVLSSNYCLAWRLMHHIPGRPASRSDPLISGWEERLAAVGKSV